MTASPGLLVNGLQAGESPAGPEEGGCPLQRSRERLAERAELRRGLKTIGLAAQAKLASAE